jgi:hypothetical protein
MTVLIVQHRFQWSKRVGFDLADGIFPSQPSTTRHN